MIRDWKMVRFILASAEMVGVAPNADGETFGQIMDRQDFNLAQNQCYWYTVEMLVQKGLLLITPHDEPDNFRDTQLWGLSWDGHDLWDKLKVDPHS